MLNERTRFILKYSLQAIIYLLVIIVVAIIFKKAVIDHNPQFWIEKFYSRPIIIYLIYIGSEVFFGLFPPELFMYWSINLGNSTSYIINLTFFTLVSVAAGHLAYFIGRYFNKYLSSTVFQKKFFVKHLPMVKKYGSLLIIVAALTPLPWSTICLIIGTIHYDYRKFTLFSLSRIFRFAVNGYLVYSSHTLFF